MNYYRGLTDAGYGFLLSDTALSPERWGQYEAVVLSSFEYMDSSMQRALVGFAQSGGLVVLGPRVPHLNERMQPDDTLGSALPEESREPISVDGAEVGNTYSVGQGRIAHVTDLTHPARAMETALRDFEPTRVSKKDPRLEVAIHRDTSDASRLVVFAANPTAEPIEAEVDLNVELKSVMDIWEGRTVTADDGGSFGDELPPYTINIYECTV